MSFPRVKIGGWATNGKLASTEINQLDINVSHSLDKTGDNVGTLGGISGKIDVLPNGGSLHFRSGSQFALSSSVNASLAGTLNVNSGGSIAFASGSTLSSVYGSNVTVNASTGSYINMSGSSISLLAGGILYADPTSIIKSSGAGGITTTVAGGISSGIDGGLKCSGTAADWLKLSSRSIGRNRFAADIYRGQKTGSLDYSQTSIAYNVIVATSPSNKVAYFDPMTVIPNNCTLNSINVNFQPFTTYTGLPSTYPYLNILRYNSDAGPTASTLRSTGAVFYGAVSLGTWNDGTVKTLQYNCDQNNVIDKNNYLYAIEFSAGNGGTGTCGVYILTFTFSLTVTDLQVF